MNFQTKELTPSQKYHLLIQTIVPRPIAWVLTRNKNETLNLSPFSYFNAVSNNPPVIMLSVGHKKSGDKKDTWRNIKREEEFVIHIPSTEDATSVSKSSFEYGSDESEVSILGLKTKSVFKHSTLPVLEKAKIAFSCELVEIVKLEKSEQGIIFGKIKEYFLDDEVVEKAGDIINVDVKKLSPIGRIGGNDFVSLGEIMTINRPVKREDEKQ